MNWIKICKKFIKFCPNNFQLHPLFDMYHLQKTIWGTEWSLKETDDIDIDTGQY